MIRDLIRTILYSFVFGQSCMLRTCTFLIKLQMGLELCIQNRLQILRIEAL